jgi:hypothetical protein
VLRLRSKDSGDSPQSPQAAPGFSGAEGGLIRGPVSLGQSGDSDQSPQGGTWALRSGGRFDNDQGGGVSFNTAGSISKSVMWI